jgi:zinc D-Ala-D-Ala carboxypeptidase
MPSQNMQISPNFTLERLTRSEIAQRSNIDNTPPEEIVENLRRLARGLEQVQALLGRTIEISSAYRCPQLNAAVGGAPNSQHAQGLAADFVCPDFGTPLEIALAIGRSDIAYDQCILEYGDWIHISFSGAPRGRLLTIHDAKQGYLAGLWDHEGKRIA